MWLAVKRGKGTHDTKAQMAVACTQTLFIFLFVIFESIGEQAYPYLYSLALAVNKSPAVIIFYHARLTDFEEKIEGLWIG